MPLRQLHLVLALHPVRCQLWLYVHARCKEGVVVPGERIRPVAVYQSKMLGLIHSGEDILDNGQFDI